MATKTWTHGGTPTTIFEPAFSGTIAPPNWLAAINIWVATNNENGDSGTVNIPSAATNTGMFWYLQNDGGIPPTATIDTLRLTYDWAVTNGPMAGGVATSFFAGSWPVGQGPVGPGVQTGAYDETASAMDVIGATDPVTLFAGTLGVIYVQNQTGVFAAHDRRLSISNLTVTVAYTPLVTPEVTSITPSSGSIVGGQAVTIRGVGFTGAPGGSLGSAVLTSFVVVDDTTITAVTAEHLSGVVDVIVTGVGTLTDGYTYVLDTIQLPPMPTRTPMTQGGGQKGIARRG